MRDNNPKYFAEAVQELSNYHDITLFNPSVTALAKAYLEIEKEFIESRKTISLLQSELNKYKGTEKL